MVKIQRSKIKIVYTPIDELRPHEENPRTWPKDAIAQLRKSIKTHGFVDPILANAAPGREGIILGGHFRYKIARELGMKEVPVVYLNIPDREQERAILIRLNKAVGEWDWNLLANFDEAFLADAGFSSEELDDIFGIDETPEQFDLWKELEKLAIKKIEIQKGDLWRLGDSKMMCGDSTVPKDFAKLVGSEQADLCLTDPPYALDYLHGKTKKGDAVIGFGAKRDRRYLETDSLPDNFTELWMKNVKRAAKDDFHIIVYENWKNIRTIWNEMEKYWKVKNMIVWHTSNRVQGFAGRYKFFSKHDIAMVGSSRESEQLNLAPEADLLQNEYETALYAISGKPHWEGYAKGKKIQPTDFIEHVAADEKSSGQGIIFGTKPLEILIPYIKVLTRRDDLILEPFGGSGSTLIAATKLKRRCYLLEKSPVYCEVIRNRWERLTKCKAQKIK